MNNFDFILLLASRYVYLINKNELKVIPVVYFLICNLSSLQCKARYGHTLLNFEQIYKNL